jgi:predicted PurR-regulated permease PerM
MKLSVEAADSAQDVKRLAKTAEKYQDKFPAVMKMLGRGVVRLTDLLWTIGSWFVAATLWLLSMAWFMLRSTTKMARFTGRAIARRRMA